MALINCPECNREISDKAKSCPHCGFQQKSADIHVGYDSNIAINASKNENARFIQMIGKLSVVFGIILLIKAFGMSVSNYNSNYINLHRISERHNIIILGCLLVLVGAILFAIFRSKYNKELSKQSIKEQHISNSITPTFISNNFVGVQYGAANIICRILLSLVSGYLIGDASITILANIHYLISVPIFIFKVIVHYMIPLSVVIYSLRNKQIEDVFCTIFFYQLILIIYNIVDRLFNANLSLAASEILQPFILLSFAYPAIGLIAIHLYRQHKIKS